MSRSPSRSLLVGVLSALAFTTVGAAVPAAAQAKPTYLDSRRPVRDRVEDLLSRMSLDEKLGQMTQAERGSITNDDITRYRLGSVLSGGGSKPTPHTPTAWADMYDGFQRAALAAPLRIPVIYGVDAVHGH